MEPVFHSRNAQPLERFMSQQTWGGWVEVAVVRSWRFCPARAGDALTADYPKVASFHSNIYGRAPLRAVSSIACRRLFVWHWQAQSQPQQLNSKSLVATSPKRQAQNQPQQVNPWSRPAQRCRPKPTTATKSLVALSPKGQAQNQPHQQLSPLAHFSLLFVLVS